MYSMCEGVMYSRCEADPDVREVMYSTFEANPDVRGVMYSRCEGSHVQQV